MFVCIPCHVIAFDSGFNSYSAGTRWRSLKVESTGQTALAVLVRHVTQWLEIVHLQFLYVASRTLTPDCVLAEVFFVTCAQRVYFFFYTCNRGALYLHFLTSVLHRYIHITQLPPPHPPHTQVYILNWKITRTLWVEKNVRVRRVSSQIFLIWVSNTASLTY